MDAPASRFEIGATLLTYEPVVDRAHKVVALRIHARRPGAGEVDVAVLYRWLAERWPVDALPVVLCAACDALPEELLDAPNTRRVALQVPAAAAVAPGGSELIAELNRRGMRLLLGGRATVPIDRALLSNFQMSVIDVGDERRHAQREIVMAHGERRALAYMHSGVSSVAGMRASFGHGARACSGWPFDDAAEHATQVDANPDFAVVANLLSLVDSDADIPDMEKVIGGDPFLAYRLLTYINSAVYGLRVEIQSFRHAVMMLGYDRLKRWLVPMLAIATRGASMHPVSFASMRRALFLEGLVKATGNALMQDEVFIVGVLSLLDKLFVGSMRDLIGKLRLPVSIQEALVERVGHYMPYLRLAESTESGDVDTLWERLYAASIPVEACNRALVNALAVKGAIAG